MARHRHRGSCFQHRLSGISVRQFRYRTGPPDSSTGLVLASALFFITVPAWHDMTIPNIKKLYKGEKGYTSDNVPCQCPVQSSRQRALCNNQRRHLKNAADDPTVVRILLLFPLFLFCLANSFYTSLSSLSFFSPFSLFCLSRKLSPSPFPLPLLSPHSISFLCLPLPFYISLFPIAATGWIISNHPYLGS